MHENPYQAEAHEPALSPRRRPIPNVFQRTLSALFLFVGSCLTVIAAAAWFYDLTQDVDLLSFPRRGVLIGNLLVGIGFIAAGWWVRRMPR